MPWDLNEAHFAFLALFLGLLWCFPYLPWVYLCRAEYKLQNHFQ